MTPSTKHKWLPILICCFLTPKEIPFRKSILRKLLRTGPSPVRWGKYGISISDCQQNISNSYSASFEPVFEPVFDPVLEPVTMMVRNEPLHDITCVATRLTPPGSQWRWKLCKFQRRKSWIFERANLALWRGRPLINISEFQISKESIYRTPHSLKESIYTVYSISSVISSASNLNQWSSSLGFCCHNLLKRNQREWDWRWDWITLEIP